MEQENGWQKLFHHKWWFRTRSTVQWLGDPSIGVRPHWYGHRVVLTGMAQTWNKQPPWTPRSSILKKVFFPPNLLNFLPNLDHWTCKLDITSKISSSLPVNDAKYGNTMLIAWYYHVAPFKRKKNNAHGLNIWFTQFFCNFKFVVIYAFFCQICIPEFSKFTKKNVFSKSGMATVWSSGLPQHHTTLPATMSHWH